MENLKSAKKLINEIERILLLAERLQEKFASEVIQVHPSYKSSALNLLHYLALRNQDIRNLQESLAAIGLSSLGRAEGHVKNSLILVRNILCRLNECNEKLISADDITYHQSRQLLIENTEAIFGPSRDGRTVRIMVTLGADSANNYSIIKDLMSRGMDCARINCAHDDQEAWIKMIDHIQRAMKETGLPCKIVMDLAGLKLRTGPLKSGPRILRIKPKRDFYGKLISPAKIWLSETKSTAPWGTDVFIPVAEEFFKHLQPGDKVYFQDKRGKKRQFEITFCEKKGCSAILYKRSFIEEGTTVFLKDKKRNIKPSKIGELLSTANFILLKKGDILILHKAAVEGESARYDDKGLIIEPAHIFCTHSEIFDEVKAGERILFNDGKIEGIINSVSSEILLIKITQAKEGGSKLGADKGINLPDSTISMKGISKGDLENLSFIANHADLVNMSFVNSPEEVNMLQEALQSLNASHIGVLLKIETQMGFKNLPSILLSAMKHYPVGVMIARGDLAIECGWNRLAEIQEEILWLCEAAHLPVVWATQVLESLAKTGSPSRAEITDAAMSQRADCVMLNKGPYILQAVEMLSDILGRMEGHQYKKTSMLRHLKITEVFNIAD